MKCLLTCAIVITIFTTITTVHSAQKTQPYFWIKTSDKQRIKLTKTIARQSNLITVFLQKIYYGTRQDPIPLPITQEELTFFCNSIIQPAQEILSNLTHSNTTTTKNYSKLMNIAEKLKAAPFYAELMEQLLPKELYKHFEPISFALEQLKQITYQKNVKKTCIKLNPYNGIKNFDVVFSNDGNYFADTISNDDSNKVNLWNATNNTLIETFFNETDVSFSPASNYIILSNIKLYFIKERVTLPLRTDVIIHNKPAISHNGRVIVLGSTTHYLSDTEPHYEWTADNFYRQCNFLPDNKSIIYSTGPHQNIELYNLKNKNTKLYDNLYGPFIINKSGSLLLATSILLNIQNPRYPTVIKKFSPKINLATNHAFFTANNFICYQTNKSFYIFDAAGKKIFTYTTQNKKEIAQDKKNIKNIYNNDKTIHQVVADTTGTCFAATIDETRYGKLVSTLLLCNLSDYQKHIPCIRITTNTDMNNIGFTKDNLLLVQSHTTTLWDMNGHMVLDLGPSQKNAINPRTGTILTANCPVIYSYTFPNDVHKAYPIFGPTKMCLYNVNCKKVQTTLTKISPLKLSQALVIHNRYIENYHHTIYPNLPDGRALAPFPEDCNFLLKKFKRSETEYAPPQTKTIKKTASTESNQTHRGGQQQRALPYNQ